MKNNSTHITLLLDRSGSMAVVASDTIGGFNTFLEDQKRVPGECSMTLTQFDSDGIDTLYDGAPIDTVKPLTRDSFVPRSNTPLYDALCTTIKRTGEFLKSKPENDRPAKVVFVVMTDGFENASTKYDQHAAQNMVKHQKDVYKWEFVFLGANIDSYAVGGNVGVSAGHTMNYAANSVGTQSAFVSTSTNLRAFRVGSKADMSFEAEDYDKQNAAGSVPNPKTK